MQDSYFNSHYQLGVYFRRLLQLTPITYLEIGIALKDMDDEWNHDTNPYHFEIFATISPNEPIDKSSYEWRECPERMISIYDINDLELNFIEKNINYHELMEDLFNQMPLLKEQDFLIYLLNVLSVDVEGVGYHRFNIHSLGPDLLSFWGKSTKSYFLSKKLHNNLKIKDEVLTKNTKI